MQNVFIVGTPKSGTTLLLSLFDGHPNVIPILEAAHYHVWINEPENLEIFTHKTKLFYEILFEEHILNQGVTYDTFLEALKRNPWDQSKTPPSRHILDQITDCVFSSLNPSSKASITHVVEKTPRHLDSIDRMIRDYPDCKIIHVLRDPRDNFLSLKRLMDKPYTQRAMYHPVRFFWNRMVASFESAYQNSKKYSDHYRIVFYEDLVREPKCLMETLTTWIDLPWEDSLLKTSFGGSSWSGNSTDENLAGQFTSIDDRPVGKWKGKLNKQELYMVELIISAYSLESRYRISGKGSLTDKIAYFLPFSGEIKRRFSLPDSEAFFTEIKFYFLLRKAIFTKLTELSKVSDEQILESSILVS
ncbi:MAG: sulfotransferase [Candidatus Lindowbacteria bacterium]|nr:sulfotransferase [Candidatus Lindowbacteria bacterium]